MKGDTLLDLVLSSAWDIVQDPTFKDLLLNKDCNVDHLCRNTTKIHSCRKGNYTNKEG